MSTEDDPKPEHPLLRRLQERLLLRKLQERIQLDKINARIAQEIDRRLPVETVQHVTRLVALCGVLGLVAGGAGIVFHALVEYTRHVFLEGLAGYFPPSPAGERPLFAEQHTVFNPIWLLFIPALGGLASGALAHFTRTPEAMGGGTDSDIDCYHRHRGRMPARLILIRPLASALTLGTGGSAGREAPIAQVCAAIGSLIARKLKLSTHERRVLVVAGMAAGVGALFQTPLAAALLASEVLYRDMDLEVDVIVPSVIASIVSYTVFTSYYGQSYLFATPELRFESAWEMLPYTALAVLMAVTARTFTRIFFSIRETFQRLRIPVFLKPALGGLLLGVIGLFRPEAIGSGYGLVQAAFFGEVELTLLLVVGLVKIFATGCTVGSGGSGGVFGPAIVIGGCFAGALGLFFEAHLPGFTPHPGAFVLVGMSAFFAAAANTPISSILMVSELTGNFHLLVPSMWVCIIAFLLTQKTNLFEAQVQHRSASPVHFGGLLGGVLETLTVEEVMQEATPLSMVKASTRMREILERFGESQHDCFPIVDDQQRLVGIVDDHILREAIGTADIEEFVVAADLARDAPLLFPKETLHSAMHKMVESKHDELVVVTNETERRVLGTLSRGTLISAYDHHVHQHAADRKRGSSTLTDLSPLSRDPSPPAAGRANKT